MAKIEVMAGWTPRGWAARLQQMADRCENLKPQLAEQYRNDAQCILNETPMWELDVRIHSPLHGGAGCIPPPLSLRESPRDELQTRSLTLRAATLDEATHSVEAVLTTEAPAQVLDTRTWSVIDEILLARGARFKSQMVLLENHNRWSLEGIIGSVRQIRHEGDKLVGRLFFGEGDARAESAWRKVRQGHVTDVSIGYRADEFVDVKPNTSQKVRGTTYSAGERTLRVTTKWTLREGSLVPIGADELAKIRAAAHSRKVSATMNETLRQYLETLGLAANAPLTEAWKYLETLEGEERAAAEGLLQRDEGGEGGEEAERQKKKVTKRPKKTARRRAGSAAVSAGRAAVAEIDDDAPEDDDSADAAEDDGEKFRSDADLEAEEISQRTLAAERRRVRRIRELAADDVPPDLLRTALDEGWSESRASARFLDAVRGIRRPPVGCGPGIHSIQPRGLEAVSAGLSLRLGLNPIDAKAPEYRRRIQERHAEAGERFRSCSLVDFCREALRLEDMRVPHGRDDLIRAAISTASMTNIFSTNLNMALMVAFSEGVDTTQGWCRETGPMNFLTNERVGLDVLATLPRQPEEGEAEHATLGDYKETYKIARYAYQFVIDERSIINDQAGALIEWPERMGRAARRLRPNLVYSLLLANAALEADSLALFEAGTHVNLGSGALAAATLQTAIAAMSAQRANGETLNIRPRFLIVPSALEFTAKTLITSAWRTSDQGEANPLRDLGIQVVVDDRIGALGVIDPATKTAYTGTATNYFLAASPSEAPTIEVGYLGGQRNPVIRNTPLTAGRWGLAFDVKYDLGVKALGFQGMYKSTGA